MFRVAIILSALLLVSTWRSDGFQMPVNLFRMEAGLSKQHQHQHQHQHQEGSSAPTGDWRLFAGNNKLTDERKRKLGVLDEEDEYDLDFALENNTDPLISKIIAGSLIVTIISLLVVGVIIPYTTDYGEGVCNPLLTGGRC